MLRIDQSGAGSTMTVKLEGRLVVPWVVELENVLAAVEVGHTVVLDLGSVSHADDAGLKVLRAALANGASISSVSGFIACLLKGQPFPGGRR